ncbi:MAG: septum formation inhibitor Maf [Crocinitomicaceae bacterium]|nr:septum formation inhibitor Maf [Crocinitomicaceae bacterium]
MKSSEELIKPRNTDEFGDFWYDGKAEVSSYELTQARYGELHEGKGVMIFVTEPFSRSSQTKADNPTKDDPNVLKMNFTRKFNTGIYPYSIMTSTFYPVATQEHAFKVSTSIQEWCGHVYMELDKKSDYEITVHSYFEGENNQEIQQDIVHLEDEIWTQIRLDPQELPVGEVEMIPSFAYIRLMHQDIKPYKCKTTLTESADTSAYSMVYSELGRVMTIKFETAFPHKIYSWIDSYESGFGDNKSMLTSSGKLDKSIRVDYWNKNALKDSIYRADLNLEH